MGSFGNDMMQWHVDALPRELDHGASQHIWDKTPSDKKKSSGSVISSREPVATAGHPTWSDSETGLSNPVLTPADPKPRANTLLTEQQGAGTTLLT